MALPPQCFTTAPYGHPFPNESVAGRKSAWSDRVRVMAEAAVSLLDPRAAYTYKAGAFDVDRAISSLYAALRKHSMMNATTLSAQKIHIL